MTEATFDKNSFGQNTTLSGEMAIIRQLYNLFTMPKGSDPYNPDKGCDIMNVVYYRTVQEVNVAELNRVIKDQVKTYTPYTISDISCMVKNKDGQNYLCIVFGLLPYIGNYVLVSNGKTSRVSKLKSPSEQLSSALN